MSQEKNIVEKNDNESGLLYASGLLFLISGSILTILFAIIIYDTIWYWRWMMDPCCYCVPYPYNIREINLPMLFHFFIGDVVFLTWTITAIVCGIMGMKNYKGPQNANRSLKGGIIAVTIHLIGMVVFLLIGASMNIIGLILLLIYALHIMGAYRQRKGWFTDEKTTSALGWFFLKEEK